MRLIRRMQRKTKGPSDARPFRLVGTASGLRACVLHGVADVLLELREVIAEHAGQFVCLGVVCRLVAPRVAWVEDVRRYVGDLSWNGQAEDRIDVHLRLGEIAA